MCGVHRKVVSDFVTIRLGLALADLRNNSDLLQRRDIVAFYTLEDHAIFYFFWNGVSAQEPRTTDIDPNDYRNSLYG